MSHQALFVGCGVNALSDLRFGFVGLIRRDSVASGDGCQMRRERLFPASGEINSKLAQPVEAINRVEQHFSREALAVDRTDGISMTFADWRFNLRTSNTEPVVRLNVESRGDVPLMEEKTKLILALLNK